ncbi:hypothetical protein SERLADRAFT_382325 [Serpula lacrymans var. lacrymans S7.9]|uniref:arginyltransferase n=1 Tax=Serpula lacrymans var. lacrymans (strain S7.9) TaxID=578457 RepID=F8NMQ2_SERL9|nr:uncharacterized protein SERLADRAFT_382325 [Serpula lacrymans var. lacrymans S7.9]EGO27449.1 hypothetical protein SERLADRAFT_382325 [Serpula lacrymans var. lacrymans S7.9]
MPVLSIGQALGPGSSSCGYCRPPEHRRSINETSYKKAGLLAVKLSCNVYQRMIDRGWRRSGKYCYSPDLRRSCCPQYTIKLDALEYKPSRSQRKVVNRWNRYILDSDNKQPQSSTKQLSFSLQSSIHASEDSFKSTERAAHKFEVKLEPASYSDEKYALYRRYQSQIHQDPDSSSTGFKNFLVQSPLVPEPIPYADSSNVPRHLPRDYGSYHQLYRLDDELIAVGVIDILPFCVSSVYFFYDAKWEKYSLGKLSAMREASLIQEMHAAGAQTMDSLYMGFYIHSCPKMRYKGEYSPSYLADPEEFTWYPLNSCISKLEQYRYATFRYPEHSLEGSGDPGEEGPATAIPNQSLSDVKVVNSIEEGVVYVIPVIASDHWKNGLLRNEFTSCIRALGVDLAKEITFYA